MVKKNWRTGTLAIHAGQEIGPNGERAVSIAQALQADGFDVRAIRPPSVPPGSARLRISVIAGLSERTLDTLAGLVSAALCSAACSSPASSGRSYTKSRL
jgi:hypothetical protein